MAVPGPPAPAAADRGGLQVTLSPLLVSCLAAAVAATVALIVVAIVESGAPPPPPPPGGGRPPPPPSSGVGSTIATGVFTIAWIAVIIAFCRDHVVRRIGQLEERLAAWTSEYGEQRETDGYLRGLRPPAPTDAPGGELRQLHPRPPPD